MKYNLDDLTYLMQRLRDPDKGCPWDLQQTSKTIVNYSIEEIYELADAIEQDDIEATSDELGDVLFQVIFLAQLAKEENHFDISDVINRICQKLIRRHPHIFIDGNLYESSSNKTPQLSSEQVTWNWEIIKKQERQNKQQTDLFDDVPLALPAMLRAMKIQKRAAGIGFDWQDLVGPLKKLHEEMNELEHAINKQDELFDNYDEKVSDKTLNESVKTEIKEELGDLLFTIVNISRKLSINPEEALRMANKKFVKRVQRIQGFKEFNQNIDEDKLDILWKRSKAEEGV